MPSSTIASWPVGQVASRLKHSGRELVPAVDADGAGLHREVDAPLTGVRVDLGLGASARLRRCRAAGPELVAGDDGAVAGPSRSSTTVAWPGRPGRRASSGSPPVGTVDGRAGAVGRRRRRSRRCRRRRRSCRRLRRWSWRPRRGAAGCRAVGRFGNGGGRAGHRLATRRAAGSAAPAGSAARRSGRRARGRGPGPSRRAARRRSLLPWRVISGSATPSASTRLRMMSIAWSSTPLSTVAFGCSTTEAPPCRSRPSCGLLPVTSVRPRATDGDDDDDDEGENEVAPHRSAVVVARRLLRTARSAPASESSRRSSARRPVAAPLVSDLGDGPASHPHLDALGDLEPGWCRPRAR